MYIHKYTWMNRKDGLWTLLDYVQIVVSANERLECEYAEIGSWWDV